MKKIRNPQFIIPLLLLLMICTSVDAQKKPLPKTISGGVLNSKARSLPKPVYPADMRAARIGGRVRVQVLIDETGKVVSAKTVSGSENPSFCQAAEAAALLSTFAPTLLSGQPVKVSGVIEYIFVAEVPNEEKLKVLGVSTFLTIARKFAPDMEALYKTFDGDDMFTDGVVEFPEFADEFTSLTTLRKLPVAKRFELIDAALASAGSKTKGSDRWQFELGRDFGEMMGSLMWFISSSGGEEPDLTKLDLPAIRLNLAKIKQHILSAPSDFPADVLAGFKDIAAFSDTDKLSNPENLRDMMEKMTALLDTISPEPEK